jgi:hypothetical protein
MSDDGGALVDQGYIGEDEAEAAQAHSIRLEVVKRPDAKRGFVLLLRRWAERSFAWMARDYERLPETLVGRHLVGFVITRLRGAADLVPVQNML